jgi:hypothetical protein
VRNGNGKAGIAGFIQIFAMASPPPPMDGHSSLRVFRHRFRGGVCCEMTIDLEKLRNREGGYLRCEWSQRPSRRIVAEYRLWILSVWQRVSAETGFRMMELLQTRARSWEVWLFAPGEAPRKVEEIAL